MMIFRSSTFLAFSLFLLSILGCSHVISPQMRQAARKDIAFPAILHNPLAFTGSTVILGGVIIETLNRPDGTRVKILETPLDPQGRPLDEEHSRGRFLAETQEYLDREVYAKGKKVVLAGRIVGQVAEPLGETHYTYPVIRIVELHLLRNGPYGWPRFSFGFGLGYYGH